jgi:putative Mg2+ transporter-C (MgtC) family protein
MTIIEFLPPWAHNLNDTELSMPVKASLEILTAIFCGLVVGSERERKGKPAGLRTMTLISLGAAIFTVLSTYLATSTDGRFNDPARLAAQIVTGVGFLGAGVIMRDRGAVTGLTTAATIWVTAAIGVIAGCGFVVPAIFTSVITLLLLHGLNLFDRDWLHPHSKKQNWEMIFDDEHGLIVLRIYHVFSTHNIRIITKVQAQEESNAIRKTIVFEITNHSRFHTQMLAELTEIENVFSIKKATEKPSPSSS